MWIHMEIYGKHWKIHSQVHLAKLQLATTLRRLAGPDQAPGAHGVLVVDLSGAPWQFKHGKPRRWKRRHFGGRKKPWHKAMCYAAPSRFPFQNTPRIGMNGSPILGCSPGHPWHTVEWPASLDTSGETWLDSSVLWLEVPRNPLVVGKRPVVEATRC